MWHLTERRENYTSTTGVKMNMVEAGASGVQQLAKGAMIGGSGVAVFFGKFTANDVAAITGAIVAVVGLVATIYFKLRAARAYERKLDSMTAEDFRRSVGMTDG